MPKNINPEIVRFKVTWSERAVTVATTSLAVLVIAAIAALMGMA